MIPGNDQVVFSIDFETLDPFIHARKLLSPLNIELDIPSVRVEQHRLLGVILTLEGEVVNIASVYTCCDYLTTFFIKACVLNKSVLDWQFFNQSEVLVEYQ